MFFKCCLLAPHSFNFKEEMFSDFSVFHLCLYFPFLDHLQQRAKAEKIFSSARFNYIGQNRIVVLLTMMLYVLYKNRTSTKTIFCFRRETKIIHRIGAYFAGNSAFLYSSASIATLISVVTFVLTEEELTTFTVFTLLSYLATLQFCICYSIGDSLRNLGEMSISIRRIQKFLLDDPLFPDGSADDGKTVIKDRWLNKRFRKLSAYGRGKRYRYDGKRLKI